MSEDVLKKTTTHKQLMRRYLVIVGIGRESDILKFVYIRLPVSKDIVNRKFIRE
jgi:hypothetical protein